MKMIVGLGNVGFRYEITRHNTGFMVVNAFAEKHLIPIRTHKMDANVGSGHIKTHKVILVKPTTFMNDSGSAVKPLMDYYKLDLASLIVVYDDMDLPVGRIRIRDHGSAGGHNGIKSLIRNLGTSKFNRIRIGTAHPKHSTVDDYVLSPFTAEQKPKFDRAKSRAVKALDGWVAGISIHQLENDYN